jgi:hypothetical protein
VSSPFFIPLVGFFVHPVDHPGAIPKPLIISPFEWYDFYDKTLLTRGLGLFTILVAV